MNRYLDPRIISSSDNNTSGLDNEKSGEISEKYKYSLSRNPKNLSTLWIEYTEGIGGRKPASEFTPSQKGRVKSQYWKRNLVWKQIYRLVKAGFNSEAACANIQDDYGCLLPVRMLMQRMSEESRKGEECHPSLRL